MARKKSEGPREPKLLRIGVAAHELGLHPFTVRRWIKLGKIQAVRIGLEARIPRSEIERLVGKTDERLLVLYGRVSGQGQREDLETQLARLNSGRKQSAQAFPQWFSPILALVSSRHASSSRAS
jgi:excisionase family DNA binding protein